MFTNKDGYLKGGVEISIPPQNLIKDPVVKDVVDRFDATVDSESIKPGNQRG